MWSSSPCHITRTSSDETLSDFLKSAVSEGLPALQIRLDILLQPPHRPHLFPRRQRQLILDVLRAFLRPVAVVEQHFGTLRRRELDHRVERVARHRFDLAVLERRRADGPDRAEL